MRLFLGTTIPIPATEALQAKLSSYFIGKWVEPENQHLTWLFLGDQPDPDAIIKALEGMDIERFPIILQGLHLFGGKVLVVSGYPHDPLHKIHDELKRRLTFLKYEDDKMFHAHVTLARIKEIRSRKIYAEAKLTREEVYVETSDWKVALFQSELTSAGPVYKILKEF